MWKCDQCDLRQLLGFSHCAVPAHSTPNGGVSVPLGPLLAKLPPKMVPGARGAGVLGHCCIPPPLPSVHRTKCDCLEKKLGRRSFWRNASPLMPRPSARMRVRIRGPGGRPACGSLPGRGGASACGARRARSPDGLGRTRIPPKLVICTRQWQRQIFVPPPNRCSLKDPGVPQSGWKKGAGRTSSPLGGPWGRGYPKKNPKSPNPVGIFQRKVKPQNHPKSAIFGPF